MDPQNQPQVADNQIQPGSLNFVPSGPSGIGAGAESIPTIAIPESQTPEAFTPEIQKPQEVEPSIEKETFVPLAAVVKKETPKDLATIKTTTPTDKPNVVDQTKDVAPLHHIAQTHDKLTSIADKEEEDFIKEVETVHEHK